MTILIPITRPAAAEAAAGPLRLSLPFRGELPPVGAAPAATAPPQAQLLAAAAAAAVNDPADALAVVRQARDQFDVIAAAALDAAEIRAVFDAITAAQDDATAKFEVSDEQGIAANAVGANPRLVAAAAAAMAAAGVGRNVRLFVARLDRADLLDQAARAVLKGEAVDVLSTQAEVKTLRAKVDALGADLEKITADIAAGRDQVAAQFKEVNGKLEEIYYLLRHPPA